MFDTGTALPMCDMRDGSIRNFKTSLPHHALSQEKTTDRFMTRKMLSAGACADARNNLVEIIETNCRVRWHVVPNWLRHSRTNHLHGSHPQIHQMERVPTVVTTGLRRISTNSHYTELDRLDFPSANQNIHNDHVGGAENTCVQTARFVANLIAHVGRIELVRWGR